MAAGLRVDHDVVRWMQERLDAASPDLLREMVKTFAEALMAAEAETLCNAGYRERTAERANSRDGADGAEAALRVPLPGLAA